MSKSLADNVTIHSGCGIKLRIARDPALDRSRNHSETIWFKNWVPRTFKLRLGVDRNQLLKLLFGALRRFRSCELIKKYSWLRRLSQNALLNEDVFGALVHIVLDSAHISPLDLPRCFFFARLVQQIWPQSVNHDFEVERLIVELFVELAVPLICLLFFLEDALSSLKFLLLLGSVVLENCKALTHLLLDEHVVLHATLEHLRSLATILTDPARVSLPVKVSVCDLIYV